MFSLIEKDSGFLKIYFKQNELYQVNGIFFQSHSEENIMEYYNVEEKLWSNEILRKKM